MRIHCHLTFLAAALFLCGCGDAPDDPMPDTATHTEFRTRVIEIATEVLPDIDFRPSTEDPEVVLAGALQLSLRNLRASFELEDPSEDEFRKMVERQFGELLASYEISLEDFSLDGLRDQLFPQIAPADYPNTVSFPLGSEIKIAIVANFPETYKYLRTEDIARWGVSKEELYDVAIENLDKASREMRLEVLEDGVDSVIQIRHGDGYDAARILLPGVQKHVAAHIGDTFRFGLPNRDYLICWSVESTDEAFLENMELVVKSNAQRPHPLSSSIFRRDPDGTLREEINADDPAESE